MRIYVVQGSCGEYSNHEEWLVCAFKEEQKAKDFVIQLTQEAQALVSRYGNSHYSWLYGDDPDPLKFRDESEKELPPNDPHFNFDSSGFNYTYLETDLEG